MSAAAAGRRLPLVLMTWFGCAFAVIGCTPLSGGGGSVAPNGAMIREQVVRVGQFANVGALAIAPTRAFVVGDGGLAMYDRVARRWLPPMPLGFGGPRTAGYSEPCAAVTNLIGDAVWIACGSRITVVRPAIGAVWATDVARPVTALSVNRSGSEAWAFIGSDVAVVSASGNARPLSEGERVPTDRIAARTVVGGAAVVQTINDPLLTRDDALHVWPPTAAARADGAGETWVGTFGGGVFLADIAFHRTRQLPFGLRGGFVRWVARTATGVIVAEQPVGGGQDRSLIATASDDLERWEWPSLYNGLGAISAVAAREGTLCIAGELGAGLASLAPLSSSPSAVLANDHRVFEPAYVAIATRSGCAVGTDRNVALLPWPAGGDSSASEPRTLGLTPPVRALAASGDTIWIGTAGGVYRAVGPGPARPVMLPASVSPNVVGLALAGDGLAIATDGELWLASGEGRTGSLVRPTVSVSRLGRLTTLASDATTLWVGGSNGALVIALGTGQALDVPLDDPTAVAPPTFGGREVHSIALAPGVAWVGTSAGLVRVRRAPDGLPR